jgi:hypothetical protein
MTRILDENHKRPAGEQISFDFLSDPTPMEVAIQTWLEDRDFLEGKHAEQTSRPGVRSKHFRVTLQRRLRKSIRPRSKDCHRCG